MIRPLVMPHPLTAFFRRSHGALLIFSTLLTIAPFHSRVASATPPQYCDDSLVPRDYQNLRTELKAVMARDLESGRVGAWCSNMVYKNQVSLDFDPSVTNERAVVSLGSGPDIHSLMHSFPFASEYHLVDIMSGWGTGPSDVFDELLGRLRTLAGTEGSVRLVRPGFLRFSPRQTWNSRRGPWRQLSPDEYSHYKKPAVWEVRWVSPSSGPQKRLVFLHVLDFNNREHIGPLIGRLRNPGLGGILIQGIGLPAKEVTKALLRSLSPSGVLHIGLNYRRSLAEAPSDETLREFKLIESAGLALEQKIEPDDVTFASEPHLFFPDDCLFRRRAPSRGRVQR